MTEMHSYIAYLRYKEELKLLDSDHIFENSIKSKHLNINFKYNLPYTYFRRNFLKRLERDGKLFCVYCGCKLELVHPSQITSSNKINNIKISDIKTFPTVDHINPISMGGFKYCESNYVCACQSCNGKKGSLPAYKISDEKYIF